MTEREEAMEPEDPIKEAVRQLNWKKFKSVLETYAAPQDLFDDMLLVVWHADSMVRRRPGDDGIKRDKFLESFSNYFRDHGVTKAEGLVAEMRSKLLKIDQGYVEIHSVVPKMKSAELTPQDRIAGAFAALDYATRRTIEDTNKKIEKVGYFGPERNLIDSENNQYDPNANTHGLTVAAGDVIMLEAYRNKWFDDKKRVVLPDFEKANDDAANWAVANLHNAHMWRLWKNIDERVRFLNGNLVELPEPRADWISHIKSP